MRIAPSKSRAVRLAVVVALVALGCLATTARADIGTKIIERCTHGQSLGGFRQQDYRRALQELPTEVEEYSDCANLIRRAQLAAAGGGSGVGAPAVATVLTPSERNTLNKVAKSGAKPLSVGGQVVHPGVVHANVASALSSLPDPLLALLGFLLACGLALGGRAIGRSVRAHRSG